MEVFSASSVQTPASDLCDWWQRGKKVTEARLDFHFNVCTGDGRHWYMSTIRLLSWAQLSSLCAFSHKDIWLWGVLGGGEEGAAPAHISGVFETLSYLEIPELKWFHGASAQIWQWSMKLSHSMLRGDGGWWCVGLVLVVVVVVVGRPFFFSSDTFFLLLIQQKKAFFRYFQRPSSSGSFVCSVLCCKSRARWDYRRRLHLNGHWNSSFYCVSGRMVCRQTALV